MEIYETPVKTIVRANMGWAEMALMPIGDVQLGAEACNLDYFGEWMDRGRGLKAMYLGMGDYIDVASPSNRVRIKQADLYDSVQDALEDAAARAVDKFLAAVHGTRGRWVGILEGHHYYEFRDGTTTDTRIAQALDAPFLGNCAFVRLTFGNKTTGHKGRQTKTIWCHHGAGSGLLTSSPLTRLERITDSFEADVYLIGHHHRQVAAPKPQLYMTNRLPFSVKEKRRILACTGGFLKGYMMGSKAGLRPSGTYVEKRMLPPVALGGIILRFKPKSQRNNERVDMTVEL